METFVGSVFICKLCCKVQHRCQAVAACVQLWRLLADMRLHCECTMHRTPDHGSLASGHYRRMFDNCHPDTTTSP